MWQPKVLVEFHLKFKHCKILLKFSIQNIETTLWRQGVLYLHSYISCACVFFFWACQILFCGRLPQSDGPILPKKVSVIHLSPPWFSLWDFDGVIVCVDLNEHNLLANLIIVRFYDRNTWLPKILHQRWTRLFAFMQGGKSEKSHRVVWGKKISIGGNFILQTINSSQKCVLKLKIGQLNGTIFYWSNCVFWVFVP